MSLHDLINEEAEYRAQAAPTIMGSGAMGIVTQVTDSATVFVKVIDFDGGDFAWGPVPGRSLTADSPVTAGDTVILIVTSDGQPQLALKP